MAGWALSAFKILWWVAGWALSAIKLTVAFEWQIWDYLSENQWWQPFAYF